MVRHAPHSIRNVTLVGHADAGKTSLADALLFRAGAVTREGSVSAKTSVFDHDPEAKAAGHSIDASFGSLNWKKSRVHLIDTPGYPDYIGEAVTGYQASDLSLVCVNAQSGIQTNTLRTWAFGRGTRHARAIVVTKCDLMEGRLSEVLERIRARFGKRCIPWNPPAEVGDFRRAFIEAIVEVDDELMERYLSGEQISTEALDAVARPALCRSLVVPVLFVSTKTGMGLENLLDFIDELGPSPLEAPRKLVHPARPLEATALVPDPAAPFMGLVWAVRHDPHFGKKAYVQVVQGTLSPGMVVIDRRTRTRERIGHLFEAQGKEQIEVPDASPGESVMLPRLEHLLVGDTLSAEDGEEFIRCLAAPEPMYELAVVTDDPGQEAKVTEVLMKLAEDTPTLKVHRNPVTHQLIAAGMSQLHLDLVLRRLRDRSGLHVHTEPPKIAYREALTGKAEAKFRHKKQSGGRGQFAEVLLEVEPGEPGGGLQMAWAVVGGAIPRNFEPAIEKGIRERMQRGILAGYPLEGAKVTVKDGAYHEVDSSEAAFKVAGGRAFAEAAAKAKPVILEPIAALEIHIPTRAMGDVAADLATRRGRIIGMDQDGEAQVLHAEVPLAEVRDYALVLAALTSGEGDYLLRPADSAPVPAPVQKALVQAYKPTEEAD